MKEIKEELQLARIEIAAIDQASKAKGARAHLKNLSKRIKRLKIKHTVIVKSDRYNLSCNDKGLWYKDNEWHAFYDHRPWWETDDLTILILEAMVPALLEEVLQSLTTVPIVVEEKK